MRRKRLTRMRGLTGLEKFAFDVTAQNRKDFERLNFILQFCGEFLGSAFGQRAFLQKPDDFADKFLIVFSELRTAADFLRLEPFQNVSVVGAAAMR